MAWSGKLLGGVIGGMLGGPVGAAAGAAMGHLVADGTPARGVRLVRLDWVHHAFTSEGPALRLAPIWRAVGERDVDVTVSLSLGTLRRSGIVVPEAQDEVIGLPSWTVPYARLPADAEALEARVFLESRSARDSAAFDLPLPSSVRRLALSGPARLVMALVACARAGGRPLAREDVRFIRDGFVAGWPLEEAGLAWLRAWMHELDRADLARLTPGKVADRVLPHLNGDAGELLLWLMRGARAVWPGEDAVGWVDDFAEALGVADARLDALWEITQQDAVDAERMRALAALGLLPGASLDAAQAAWKALVRAHHPDLARDDASRLEATRRTAEINAAWTLLRGS